MDELEADLKHFKRRWNASDTKPSNKTAAQNQDVPVPSVSLPLNASGKLHYVQGVEDSGAITHMGSYTPGSKKHKKKRGRAEMLECYVMRYEEDGAFQDLLGCVGLSRDKRRKVWYKN